MIVTFNIPEAFKSLSMLSYLALNPKKTGKFLLGVVLWKWNFVQNLVYVPVCAICRKGHLHCLEYNCHSSVLHPVTSVCRVTDVWYIPHTYSYLPTISPRWNDWDGTTILESVLHHEFKNTAYCHMICTFQICQTSVLLQLYVYSRFWARSVVSLTTTLTLPFLQYVSFMQASGCSCHNTAGCEGTLWWAKR